MPSRYIALAVLEVSGPGLVVDLSHLLHVLRQRRVRRRRRRRQQAARGPAGGAPEGAAPAVGRPRRPRIVVRVPLPEEVNPVMDRPVAAVRPEPAHVPQHVPLQAAPPPQGRLLQLLGWLARAAHLI